jgi:hypothetical protein
MSNPLLIETSQKDLPYNMLQEKSVKGKNQSGLSKPLICFELTFYGSFTKEDFPDAAQSKAMEIQLL